MPELERLLRAKAVLLPGVKVNLHVEKGKEVKTQTWTYPRGLTGYLEEISQGMEPVAPIFEGATYLGKPKDGDDVRGRRRRGVGVRVVRGRPRRRRELRQPHSDGRRRHARGRLARGAVRSGQVVRRPSQPAAARRAPADGGHLREAALRALRAHPRSAVPGPGQGEAHEPRRAEARRADRQGSARGVAQLARRVRQAHRRARDLAGNDAHEVGAEGREEEGLRRRGAARASSPTANPTTSRAARSSSSKATRPAARRSSRATSSTRRSCRCAARC